MTLTQDELVVGKNYHHNNPSNGYSHLSQEHKKKAVDLLNGLTALSRNRYVVKNDAYLKDSGL